MYYIIISIAIISLIFLHFIFGKAAKILLDAFLSIITDLVGFTQRIKKKILEDKTTTVGQ